MANVKTCSQCGATLGAYAPRGVCPRCVLQASLSDDGSDGPLGGVGPLEAPLFAKRFGDYELLEELGHGGMGVVYRARHIKLDRFVALKLLLLGQFSSEQAVKRFQREAQAAAALRHPNIVGLHDVGEVEGQHYFTMELVEGRSLASMLRDGPLPARLAARYCRAMAEAMSAAPTAGIIHRDLKPANVLIDPFDQPRITDFGLAKRLDGSGDITLTGHMLGSPNYLAPELAAGMEKECGPGTDIFSMGAILYECLTGRPPFMAATLQETLLRIRDTEPVAPRVLNANLPRDIETVCLKCLQKESARRYATAQELADELGRFLKGEPVHARPVTRTERAWRWCRRKPALAASLGAVLVLLVTVAIVATIAAVRIAAAHKAQEREQYYANIRLSDLYIREGNTDRALDVLLQCPAKYRNWEWGRLIYQCHQEVLTIPAHTNNPTLDSQLENHLHGLAFSPDGSRLFTHGVDGLVKIWSTEDGRQLYGFGGSTNWVTSYTWDRDARRMAVGCTNGMAHVFDTQTWREIRAVQHGTKAIRWASLDSDGGKLATASKDGVVQVWDVSSGERLLRLSFPHDPPQNVSFDGSSGLLVTKHTTRIVVWNVGSGVEVSRIEPNESNVLNANTTPSPTTSPIRRERLPTLTGKGRLVSSPAIFASSENRSGTLLITFDADGNAKLWRSDGTSVELGIVKGAQSGSLRWASFSEDRKLICTGGELGTARVWEAATGQELFSIPNRVYGAQFSKDGSKLITVGSENVARVWEVSTGREYLTLRGHGALVIMAIFSPDGLRVATGGANGIVKLRSATTGREVLRGDLWTWGPCYSPDGKRAASASWGLDLRVWDTESGEELVRFRPDMEGLLSAQFSPDGRRIATGGGEGVARLWDSRTGHEVGAFPGHTRGILGVSYSPDGRRLATISADQTARIWDVETGQQLHVLLAHTKAEGQVQFSPNGQKLATAGWDVAGRIWDVESGRLLFAIGSSPEPVIGLCFTPDGGRIFTASTEKHFQIWNATTGKLLGALPLRNPVAWGFDFSPDGSRLVVTLSQRTAYGQDVPMVEVWDPEHGRDLLILRGHTEPIVHSFFRCDGRRILTSSMDMTTRQWETFPWRESEYPGSPAMALRERLATYSRAYWRERLRAEADVARKPAPQTLEPMHRWERSRWPKRDEQAHPNQIDLTEHFTGLLGVTFLPHAGIYDNHLRALPTGTITLSNVVLDIRGIIQLRRLESAGGAFRLNWERQPIQADGIKVEKTFHRLRVLHGVASDTWQVPAVEDGTEIASLVLRYHDGTQVELPILYGRHVRDWWTRGADPVEALKPLENGTVVWTGTNPAAEQNDSILRLYLSSYENPKPGVEVVSINYVSAMTEVAPFLVAMTIEP